jgi:hypothetical protein
MNFASEDFKDMLEDGSSLGLTFNDNLFVGRRPRGTDNSVTLFDYEGGPPEPTLDKGTLIFNSSVQVQVRNRNYPEGLTLARNIMDYLHLRAQEEWNSTLYTFILAEREPAFLSWDENGNALFIINFNIKRR